MARHSNPKCRQCAKLSTEEAQKKDCWIASCKQKRYYHRNHAAINRTRRKRDDRLIEMPEIAEIAKSPIVTPVIVYYRANKETQPHAVGAELKVNCATALRSEVKHCKGATEAQIMDWLAVVLMKFSNQYGKDVGKFIKNHSVEYLPSQCPICQGTQQTGK